MDFRGHLRLPDDADPGIPVVLRLDDIFVIISSGGDELGAWRADDVDIERIFSNQFAIDLDGELMVFVAQDALGFAYEGVTAIEELQARLAKRGIFRRPRKRDKREAAADAVSEPEPAEAVADQPVRTSEPARRPAAELVSHLEHPGGTEPDAPAPDRRPVPESAPAALWTPATAKAAPTATERSEPGVDVPLPAETPGGSDARTATDERPTDTRVSYPRASVPPPPTAESFVPPPVAESEPAPVPEVQPEPEVQLEPEVRLEPEVQPEPVVQPVPVPELEIEEVTAAASGAAWGDDVTDAVSVPELEIEDHVPPTAGAVDTFVAPQSRAEPVSKPDPEPVSKPDPETAPAQEPVKAPIEDEVEDEVDDLAGDNVESVVPAAEPAAHAAHADELAVTNGHKAEKRRSFLFGRGRDKSVPAHDHAYGEPKTIGGLTRQVCGVCGHVTFSGQDVYQDW